MTLWERWSFNALHGVVTLTGAAYFYMKYLLATDDPFAVINHPWQPTMLALHVVAAPFFLVIFGVVLRSHTLRKIASPVSPNRRTGWTALASFASMALTGYFLQVVADPVWHRVLVWAHVVTSVLFVVGYGIHLVISWRLEKAPAADPEAELTQPARLSL